MLVIKTKEGIFCFINESFSINEKNKTLKLFDEKIKINEKDPSKRTILNVTYPFKDIIAAELNGERFILKGNLVNSLLKNAVEEEKPNQPTNG